MNEVQNTVLTAEQLKAIDEMQKQIAARQQEDALKSRIENFANASPVNKELLKYEQEVLSLNPALKTVSDPKAFEQGFLITAKVLVERDEAKAAIQKAAVPPVNQPAIDNSLNSPAGGAVLPPAQSVESVKLHICGGAKQGGAVFDGKSFDLAALDKPIPGTESQAAHLKRIASNPNWNQLPTY